MPSRPKRLREYHVMWEIELSATSARDAAKQALDVQRDPDSTATIFTVYELRPPPKGDPNVIKLVTSYAPVRIDLGKSYRRRTGK